MAVVANVAVNVDASKAIASLRGLESATNTVGQAADRLSTRFGAAIQGLGGRISALGQSMQGLGGIAAQIGGTALVGGFVKAGIEADRTGKTIKALTSQYQETAGVTKLASDAAKQYGLGQTTAAKSVADLYGRLRPMGVSLENIGKTFNGVNKAAGLMNLTAADTEGVLLQLSQAMGSGALQGDELRSIMERLPAVGQAVAKVMGVTVGEVKQLGADGKITTDVLIKAMDELNKIKPPPPDAYKLFQAAMEDLNTTVGQQLLPVFTPLVQKLTELVGKFQELGVGTTIAQALVPLGEALLGLLEGFMALDPATQKFIIQFGAIALAVSLIIVPLGIVIGAIGSIISAVGAVAGALGGLSILATIAGWLGALGPAVAGVIGFLQGLGTILAAVFTGPVGWAVLLVAAGVAIYAFRDKIGAAFQAIGKFFGDLFKNAKAVFFDPLAKGFSAAVEFVKTNFIAPMTVGIQDLVKKIGQIFKSVVDFMVAPFKAAASAIKGVMNSVLGFVENSINSVINAINNLIRNVNRIAARLKLPQIPLIGNVSIPRFAEGGYVAEPTVAMVGEGNEPEYIIPQSKMNEAIARYSAGKRGDDVIPGGNVNPQVSITTGPVMQMEGTNYVTQSDLVRATAMAAKQGSELALSTLRRNPNTRAGAGVR